MISQIAFWMALAGLFRTLAREWNKDLDQIEERMDEEEEE